MWTYNNDYKKWSSLDDRISKYDFDLLKQELKSTRFYSKCLSGSTYLPADDLTDIYSILGKYEPKNWYISTVGSIYSYTTIPSQFATPIKSDTSYDYYTKSLSEYGLTLKNLFTPNRLIKDSLNNFNYVDVATIDYLDLSLTNNDYVIDGVKLINGHRILIKNQTTTTVLLSGIDPSTYFTSNYEIVRDLGATIEYKYYNEENGIYIFNNGKLEKTSDLSNYENCIRYSVSVKLGYNNTGKQFHLSRLLNGYYPTTSLNQPIEFKPKNNWILRNRVDYNNLFEINYYDVYKHVKKEYSYEQFTYSIPERTLSVGEFGVILNTQAGKSNIIPNKYKVNLRGISETSQYYWICGDDGIILRVRKHDFEITRIVLELTHRLNSITFYDDLKGAVVGDFNTIMVTKNGGVSWESIKIDELKSYNYSKVITSTTNSFYIAGDNGIFIEIKEDITGWTLYKKRIFRQADIDDEYLLVDDIKDLYKTTINTWGITYSYYTQSIPDNKELLFITSDNNIIVYDINNSFSSLGKEFIYFDFGVEYSDIKNITRRNGTDDFYFSGTDNTNQSGIFSFDINNFKYLGPDGSYSNVTVGLTAATFEYSTYTNEIFDYNGDEIIICGNTSLLLSSTYSNTFNFNLLDPTFEDKLKSRLLILDYDIASKLNFFTDDGYYRLPNSVTFSSTSVDGYGKYLSFNPIFHEATNTQESYYETNWITYWTDAQKTFEFYSLSPLSDSKEVKISTTFSYTLNDTSISFTSDKVTSQIGQLAPNISSYTHSRYDGQGGVLISHDPLSTYQLYLYDYLMVVKTPHTFDASVGDVLKLDSSVVDGEFIINRMETFGSASLAVNYLYVFTEFNENIINDLLSTTYSITISNLNKYKTNDELILNFNTHPISNAYELSVNLQTLQVSPLFNNLTSYYNLGTNIQLSGTYSTMKYTSGFLNFGYSPTYNLMDYLIGLNNTGDINPKFYSSKEFLSMPVYKNIPMGSLSSTTTYIDYNGMTYSGGSMSLPGNKILFGADLKLEWESIFLNTFVDVILYNGVNSTLTEKLLVMNKYYDSVNDAYSIEFHKSLNYELGVPLDKVDIISRRKLSEISSDLQEMNNIQRSKSKKNSWKDQGLFTYETYQNELNFKIPTDSYAKILISDVDIPQQLSAMIYIDYKNELAMNITRLSSVNEIPIVNTFPHTVGSSNKLRISCSTKHELSDGDGVVLSFNGDTGSSQDLNPQYFGYHVITKISDYDFYTEMEYGLPSVKGDDVGYVKYTKQDPFLNYLPVDLIDLGVDGKGKQSIELKTENLVLKNDKYSLDNVDYNKYRFRLIDGLDIDTVNNNYPWLLEAEVSGAVIGGKGSELVWYKGTWEFGRWFGGTWNSGTWKSGDWYGGTWNSYKITDNILSVDVNEKSSNIDSSIWYTGRWFGGTWTNGTWYDGRWYDGSWNNGEWLKGTWNDGTWNNGKFKGGIWVLGTWNQGVFNTDSDPSYWLDGKWNGGDFENGMWYNGIWEQKNGLSRFGTKSYNSRTSTWHGGKWISGTFYSKLNTNDNGLLDVSETHKYSIWKTGQWLSGEWYGGVAYNMDFKTGTWYGGILEDIQVIGIGIDSDTQTFTLNGIFKFNIGDIIYIIDNQIGSTNSVLGSNTTPGKYTILNTMEYNGNTIIYVNGSLSSISILPPVNTNLRVVSKFSNINWKSGIWTNGLFENGLWEGGIWYNGVFYENATWM